LLSGLFEPYCLAGELTELEVRSALAERGISPLTVTPLGKARHVFSHLEWHMTGFEITLDDQDAEKLPHGLFLASHDDIDTTYALPSAYRAYRAFM